MPCAQRRMSVADTGSSSCTLGRGWLMYRSTSLVSSTVLAGASLIALPLRSHAHRGYLLYESILRLSADGVNEGQPLGSPSTRSPMMFRCTSEVPPYRPDDSASCRSKAT